MFTITRYQNCVRERTRVYLDVMAVSNTSMPCKLNEPQVKFDITVAKLLVDRCQNTL